MIKADRNRPDANSADGRELPRPPRRIRSRKGRRTQRELGEPVSLELRDGRCIPGTVVDTSASGLGVTVADHSLFHRGQVVAVRQRGMRTRALIRNVQNEAEGCRLALQLSPA